MTAALIATAARSPIAKQRGALASCTPDVLAGAVMRALLSRYAVTEVDRVLLANTTNPGNIARTAALAAGLPPTTPATTVNNQCAGGLTAIRIAAEAIEAGQAGLVLAGGVESVSHAAVALEGRSPRGDGIAERPRVRHVPEGWPDPGMGPSADAVALRLGIGRAEQDAYAHASYARAAEARASGVLTSSILTVDGASEDELAKRPPPELERLARYPAAFGPGGRVTAGNCASAADGAGVALLGTAEAMAAAGLEARTRIVAAAPAAGDPALPALAVLPAIEAVLAQARLTANDIDLWEVNEAFAVKVLAVMREFGIDHARMNVLGGAIAYGHPFAASGAILLAHLLAALEARGARRGLLALAGAGGVAEAMVIERLDGRS